MDAPAAPRKPAPRQPSSLAALWALWLSYVLAVWTTTVAQARHVAFAVMRAVMPSGGFRRDVAGNVSLGTTGGVVLALILAFVIPLLLIPVAAKLAPGYFVGLRDLYNATINANFGDDLVDPLMPILGSVLLLIGVFGFLAIAGTVLAIKYTRGKAS